jgi:hypothetical protein
MRTKCTGGNHCEKCRKDGAACIFGDRKRERNRKYARASPLHNELLTERWDRDLAESLLQIEDLKTKNNMLLDALKTVAASPNLDHIETTKIREMIVNVCSRTLVEA